MARPKLVQNTQGSQSSQSYAPRKKQRQYQPNRIARLPKGKALVQQQEVTLRYHHRTAILTGATGVGSALFYANGMYQPQVGAVTHQPHYFDQLMSLYDHFRVTKSKITVTCGTTPDTFDYILSCFIDDDTTPSLALAHDPIERQGSVFAYRPAQTVGTTQVTKYFNAKDTFGVKGMNDSFIGTATSNPDENATFVASVSGSPAVTYVLSVFIEYTAVLSELASVSSS